MLSVCLLIFLPPIMWRISGYVLPTDSVRTLFSTVRMYWLCSFWFVKARVHINSVLFWFDREDCWPEEPRPYKQSPPVFLLWGTGFEWPQYIVVTITIILIIIVIITIIIITIIIISCTRLLTRGTAAPQVASGAHLCFCFDGLRTLHFGILFLFTIS